MDNYQDKSQRTFLKNRICVKQHMTYHRVNDFRLSIASRINNRTFLSKSDYSHKNQRILLVYYRCKKGISQHFLLSTILNAQRQFVSLSQKVLTLAFISSTTKSILNLTGLKHDSYFPLQRSTTTKRSYCAR